MTIHGGDVWSVSETLGVPAAQLLDFSANINPRGLPTKARERLLRDAADTRLLSCYPDPDAGCLRRALGKHLDCAPESIVVGSGAESLMSPILRSLRVHRALIPIPAFSEYRRVCQQEQIEFVPFPLLRSEEFGVPVNRFCESIKNSRCDLVLLNNPHNPSGALLTRREVRTIVEAALSCGSRVVLDEAFIDYAADESLVSDAVNTSKLIVIRSLTKFYGCPALRVGYAVTQPDMIRRIRDLVPTWPVTQLAMDALAEAIADTDYAAVSLRENETERRQLSEVFAQLGLKVFPSAANYLFLELEASMPTASELRSKLMHQDGILIRNCDSYEGLDAGRYVRVAVRSQSDNNRLIAALQRAFKLT